MIGAPVSRPLHREELKEGLSPQQFKIDDVHENLEKSGDIFKPLLQQKFSMETALEKLDEIEL